MPPLIDEWQRITTLRRAQILDTLPEQAFDDLAALAAQVCQTPIAAISLVDTEREWFKARVGLTLPAIPRQASLATYAILHPDQIMVVPDALADERFQTSDLVTGEPHLRFYAGAPLVMADGMVLGVLCVIDTTPRELSASQRSALEVLRRSVLNEITLRTIEAENEARIATVEAHDKRVQQELLERTWAEETLRIANAQMEQALRMKDIFLANMSHELRTPLNAILSVCELLMEGIYDPLNQRQSSGVQQIEASSQHLLALINDILDISKVEAGRLDLQVETVHVSDVCRASLQFVKELAIRKQLQLSYELSEDLPPMQADARRLKQMLVNLLSNAVKFTPTGGMVRLEVQAVAEANLIRFAVHDSGIGIASEDLGRLFRPFVQLDSHLNRQQEGTGLGLTLVRRLAELHGGSISVESELGMGSCFTITLPYHGRTLEALDDATAMTDGIPAEDTRRPKHNDDQSAAGSQPGSLASGTILLVDDSEESMAATLAYLEAKGYPVIVARNGRDALDLAEQVRPALILLDIQMPEMDGLEVARRLRSMPATATTPIIALTALAMPGDRERCLAAGADEYFSKPVSLRRLTARIEQLRGA